MWVGWGKEFLYSVESQRDPGSCHLWLYHFLSVSDRWIRKQG